MLKKYFFGIMLVLLCLAGLGIYKVMKPHHNAEYENTEATLSAKDLFSEFQSDEIQAGKKWTGKVIEITGKISSVSENDKYVSILLGVTAEGGINCSVLKKDLKRGDSFKVGENITIKGKCSGFLMDVNLVDCVIKK
jgi:thioredoxin-related protein